MLLQLADEDSRGRIDLFTPASDSLAERLMTAGLGEGRCRVVAPEDLAARLLCVLYQVLAGRTVAPKYYEAFTLLAGVADLDLAAAVWREYRDDRHAKEYVTTPAAGFASFSVQSSGATGPSFDTSTERSVELEPTGMVTLIPSRVTGFFAGSAFGFEATTVSRAAAAGPAGGLACKGNGSVVAS
jgi:hypothetical protein